MATGVFDYLPHSDRRGLEVENIRFPCHACRLSGGRSSVGVEQIGKRQAIPCGLGRLRSTVAGSFGSSLWQLVPLREVRQEFVQLLRALCADPSEDIP